MAAPGLPIQELWDEVIDSIHDSTVDLKSTSLVCRSFVARAQSHIFRQIALFATKAPRTTGDMAARLRNLMAFSSHLISHVQVLYLPTADEETLISVADIRWSHVQRCAGVFQTNPSQSRNSVGEGQRVGWTAHLAHSFLPRWCVGGNTFAVHIRALHSTPSASYFFPLHSSFSFPCVTAPSCPIAAAKLSDLSVICSPDIAQILHDPVCALDFSALTKVYCVRSMSIDFEIFLLHHRATITNLHFAGTDETIYRLDLGLFPALSHIAIDEAEPAFNAMLARLPAGNRVATISLGILFFDDESSVDTKRLQEFDTTALGRNMSALLRVTAKVMAARSRSLTSPEQAEIAHTIQTALPCLHAKGLLVTVFE